MSSIRMNACGKKAIPFIISLCCLLGGCRTYYDKTLTFNQKFEEGNYNDARKYLSSQSKLQKSGVKVLYDLNYATSSFMMDSTNASIAHFWLADKYVDDFSKNYSYEALALITNPTVRPYEVEYHESVMIHFYQALNYIKQNDIENALVECRRMNLVLDNMADAFRKHDGKRYSRDAFGHLLMAILYEMSGDNNNAFIAYRNSLEIYEDDYSKLFATPVPDALKRGIIRTAYRTGFAAEGAKYESKFKIKYKATSKGKGRLITFLLDGMSPVKAERNVDFVKGRGSGVVNFSDDNTGLTIPIFWGDCTSSEQSSLNDISYIRIAIPQYVSRGSRCKGSLSINGTPQKADLVEDIDKVARQSLNDRLWKELGKSILRAAVKETVHKTVSNQNEYVGLLVNIMNAVTEKADTRCWMSLPARVRIVDTELDAGTYSVDYTSCGTESATTEIAEGRTSFLIFRGY
ncbi:MAG: COG3014 family protein [Marinilabiliaceae bacterium]